ncbi:MULTISPECIES: tetratricopeptide repeat protein [unclassified Bradyrhizobium]|uniref:tetratricopeptide repeat protein n=1 Tax=unclassified Bradyrhizobium TaxID=2631580 RepID=UPI002916A0D6|nr:MULTISPECIES: tetratricopeptide repeat protein [unclassified Bradyrhizobium]
MDAVLSGQAAALIFLQGAEARVVRLGDRSEILVRREDAGYVLQGCNDAVFRTRVTESEARSQLEDAWEDDRALRLSLIALDLEEESDLRNEAADCLEELIGISHAKRFVENRLYSQVLPSDADPTFLRDPERWPLVSDLIQDLVAKQASIELHRRAWDDLREELFAEGKPAFEEEAIRRGAFRVLASVDPTKTDPNIAIFECYGILRSLPNSREIVSEWTRHFKRASIRPIIVPDFDREADLSQEQIDTVSAYKEYQNAIQQQKAIIEKMRAGNVKIARRYTDELVDAQLKTSDPHFAAKSLCNLAQKAKSLGLFSLQLEWAERAVKLAPDDSWAHGQAADALIQFSRLDEALAEFDLAEAHGDAGFAATGRARILRHQGRLDEALLAFRSAQSSYPGDPFAWSGSAETLRDMWRLDDALNEYRQAIKRFPDELFLQCGMAAVLSDLGKLSEALEVYSSPQLRDEVVALSGKATVLRAMGKFAAALEAANYAIELHPTDPSARCSQAEIYRVRGDLPAALQLYEETKRSSPTISVAYAGYAEVLRDMRRYPEAIAAYESARKLFPSDVYIANGYANIRKVNDELEEALRLYEENVRRFPYSLVAKAGRADLLKRLGQYEDALGAYDQIIRVSPTFAAAKNGKAAILVVRGEYAAALSLLPSGEPSTRDDWIAWNIRGMALIRSGEIAQGIAHLEAGRIQTPFARERRYFERSLSVARMRRGEFAEAIDVLKDVGGMGLSNVLRLHAYAGQGQLVQANKTYQQLSDNCPTQLLDLKDAIAARFGIIGGGAPHANDNWIFSRETEVLLQAA